MITLGDARILVVGAGGLCHPASRALVAAGAKHLTIVDDDVVDATNLHRQILFDDADVGAPKAPTLAAKLERLGATPTVIEGRCLPNNALELVVAADLVIEGADNFATKFMVADACALAHTPLVQAGVVRWNGWALACTNTPEHTTCMRCVFEDIPRDRVETCAEAGVVGPVVGVLGAVQAHLAVRLLAGDDVRGELWSYRALQGTLRRTLVRAREDCPHALGAIADLQPERYVAHCAA